MTHFANSRENEYYLPEELNTIEDYHEDPCLNQTGYAFEGGPLDLMAFATDPKVTRELLIASGMSSEEMMNLSREIFAIEESFKTSGEWMHDVPHEISQIIDHNEMINDYQDEMRHVALSTPHANRTRANCPFDKGDRAKLNVLITIIGPKYIQGESDYGKVYIPLIFEKYIANIGDNHQMVVALTHVEPNKNLNVNTLPLRAIRVNPLSH